MGISPFSTHTDGYEMW